MAEYRDMVAAQFENVNSLRSYPFMDDAPVVSSDGKELPLDVIVDLHMVVPSHGGLVPEVRLSSVHMSPAMVSACIVSSCGTKRDAMSVIVARNAFRPYVPYRMERLAGSADMGGVVTFGDFEFPGFPETYSLDARIHPCCVSHTEPPKLRRFVDPRSGGSVSGDVRMSFSGYVDVSRNGSSFSLGLEKGAAEELASECAKATGAEACGATPISSINGVRPDEDGNIVLWFH